MPATIIPTPTTGDVRFEIEANPEPDDNASTHWVGIYCRDTGELLESHITGDPYGMVEAYREVQNIPFEERMEMQLEREMGERF